MSEENKISVLMSVYKNDVPEDFETAINSILNQTYKPSEVVLVIDGPVPDGINNVIKKFEDNKIFKIIRFEENKGLGTALKVGSENCTYPLIARMDSDDISLPNRFEEQIKYLSSHPEVDVVGTFGTEFIGNVDNTFALKTVPVTDEEIKKFMKKRNPINHMTVIMKKEMLLKSGGYQDWYYAEDYYLWLRMFLNGATFYNLPMDLARIRMNENSYARRHGLKYFKSIKKLFKFMRKNKIIGYFAYLKNIIIRFIGHVLVPKKLKRKMYQKFLRSKTSEVKAK